MHCWKDYSGMSLSSVITAVLIALKSSKRITLPIPLSLEKRKSHLKQYQMNKEVVPVRWCSSQLGIAERSERCEQEHCRGEAVMMPILLQLWSFLILWANHRPQDLLLDSTDWSSRPVARTRCERYPSHGRTWSKWLQHLAFFGVGDVGNF